MNIESHIAALNLVFDSISPEDEVKTDPKKIKAMAEELELDRQHNMEIMRQRGIIGTIEIISPEYYFEGEPIEGDEPPNP